MSNIIMDRDTILNMPAGREMDALVAEKVMGWIEQGSGWDTSGEESGFEAWTPDGELLPVVWLSRDNWRPSTDISAAWQVVEKLQELEHECYLFVGLSGCNFSVIDDNGEPDVNHCITLVSYATASKPELAICRAALLAVLQEDKDG